MPNLTVEDILKHFGVKGMKWGVRKQRLTTTGVLSEISGRAERRDDEVWRNRVIRSRTADALYPFNPVAGSGWGGLNDKLGKATRKAMAADIKALNSKPEYNTRLARREIKKKALGKIQKNKSGVVDKYYAEHAKIFEKHIKEQAPNFMQTSPSGKWETKLWYSRGMGAYNVDVRQVDKAKHAAGDNFDLTLRVKPIFDDDGYIVDWEFLSDDLVQSAIDDILEHHGIKGMKWGVRRSRPSAVTVSDKGKKLKTSGGHGRPATESAVRARVTAQVAKKSGVKALTDQELRDYANRIQLEQNVSRLMYNEKSRGAKFVDNMLGRQGSQLANEAAKQGATKTGRAALGAAKKSRRVAKVAATVAAI